jgi:hypothetical protein
VLNRYIKDILKDLSEQLPSLKENIKLSSEKITDEMKLADELEAQVWLLPGAR